MTTVYGGQDSLRADRRVSIFLLHIDHKVEIVGQHVLGLPLHCRCVLEICRILGVTLRLGSAACGLCAFAELVYAGCAEHVGV